MDYDLNRSLIFQSDEVKNNLEVVKKFMQKHPSDLEYASDEVKDTKALANFAIDLDPITYSLLSERLQRDKDVAWKLVTTAPSLLNRVPHDLLSNSVFASKVLELSPNYITDLPEKHLENGDIMKDVIKNCPRLMKLNRCEAIWKDFNFLAEIIADEPANIGYFPENLMKNLDFRKKIVNQAEGKNALLMATYGLTDEKLLIDVVKKDVSIFTELNPKVMTDGVVAFAIAIDPTVFKKVPLEIARKKEILTLLAVTAPDFKDFSPEQKKDKELKDNFKDVSKIVRAVNKKRIS